MPPSKNMQDKIKKYNYANVSTTPWQDPKASVLPYRGGGQYTISPKAMASYTPTYKYPIKSSTPEPEPEPESEPVAVAVVAEDSDDDDDDDDDDDGEGALLILLRLDRTDC
jgi:hypothetical protein